MTRIILTGANGKMGRVVASVCRQTDDYKIVAGVDLNVEMYDDFPIYSKIDAVTDDADVIVDFSHPSAISSVIGYAISHNLAAVICTTGLSEEQIALVKDAAQRVPVFFSANMSLGINLLVSLAKKATQILGDGFDIEIVEKHHNQKLDAPSGTALLIADAISEDKPDAEYIYDRHSRRMKRQKREIGIHSLRGGTIVGEHEIIFAGRDEVIELKHSAASKEVFAVGAVKAARFVACKAAGLYSMSDMM